MKIQMVISLMLFVGVSAFAQDGSRYERGYSSVSRSDEVKGILPITIEGDSAKLMFESLTAKEVVKDSTADSKMSVKNATNIACSKEAHQTANGSVEIYGCLIVMTKNGVARKNMNQ